MRASAIAIAALVLGAHAAPAANYPPEMRGVWAGSRGTECRDTQCVCNSYLKDPNKVDGDIDVFEKNKKRSFGGEGTPREARNISVKKIGPARWKIAERFYNDHGGPNYEGAWQTMAYEATIKDGLLVFKNEYGSHPYARCSQQSPARQGKEPKG